MNNAKTTDKPASPKPVYVLHGQKSVMLNGKVSYKGESIDGDTWKKLCPRVQPYFRKA